MRDVAQISNEEPSRRTRRVHPRIICTTEDKENEQREYEAAGHCNRWKIV